MNIRLLSNRLNGDREMKAYTKNSIRNIKNSLNRFLSIAAIVALGTGFLAGLVATTPDMEDAMDAEMDDTSWYDIDVQNTLGFSKDDIAVIKNLQTVSAVQPAYVSDAVLVSQDKTHYTARIFGYLDDAQNGTEYEKLNKLVLVSGRLPECANECVVQSPNGYTTTLPKAGECISFLNKAPGYADDKLTVTGVVTSPMFISAESEPSLKGSGSVTLAVYVMRSFYTLDSFTDVYVSVKGASELSTWSQSYKTLVQQASLEINNICTPLVEQRIKLLKEQVPAITDALNTLCDAEKKLSSDTEFRVQQSRKIASLLSQNKTQRELAQKINDVADNVQKTLEEPSEVENGLPLINEVNAQLLLLEKKHDNVWGVHTRKDNVGYASYQSNIEKIASMSKVFPVFFYLIAMLVSLTTMTRLVEERRTETGSLKAIGFSTAQLLSEYVVYALSATLLGCVIGLSAGFRIFPKVINNAYGMMYSLPPVKTPFRWNIAFAAGSIAVVCILIATLAACLAETKETPAVLMTPKAPSPGKRILLERVSFIWNKLPFSGKVTARNLFRYKKRLYMTVLGVAGCSALLTAGFGLHDSIFDIVNKQFGEVNKYDLSLVFNGETADKDDAQVHDFLNDKNTVTEWMKFSSENGTIVNGDKTQPVNICVPEKPASLEQFVSFRERLSHKKNPFTQNGIVITEKLCEQLGVSAGDYVTLINKDGIQSKTIVLGGAENYVYAYVYLFPKTYESLFAKKPAYTAALCNLTPQSNNDDTVTRIMSSSAVLYALLTKTLKNTAYKTMSSINIVVIVLILSSGILSMVVLYNLANINICERKREIATLLVLGYNEREARRYIFREIDFLSFMGIALGLLLGVPLHRFVVSTLEVNAAMWGRTIYAPSFIYAACISVAFTFMVNIVMRKSLRDINMVESMKTID